jgi:hypothetical protein
MALCTERAIIYHIPKTGGTWIKVALQAAGVRYYTPSWSKEPHPFNLKHAHSTPDNVTPQAKDGRLGITFVRQPVGWYTSYWAFRSRKGARRDEKFPADGLWSDDFDRFVSNLLDAYPQGFVTTLYQYYTGVDGQKVDFIGRQETLVDDLVRALVQAGDAFDEAALRGTRRTNRAPANWKRRCVLSAETAARVRHCEHWIWEQFYNA